MFEVKINPAKLKECFIEYRTSNHDWYIVPTTEFEYFRIYIKSYIDALGDNILSRIVLRKINDSDRIVDDILMDRFDEEMSFLFSNEEDALYFKMKYCS